MTNFNELIFTNDASLFYVIERGKNGYYVESLKNGNVKYISDLTNDVKYLMDDIIHTYSDQINMDRLFIVMKENRSIMPNPGAGKDAIKMFFRTIVPEYNEKRTLIKTLRKLIHFYALIETHEERNQNPNSLFGAWKTDYKSRSLSNKKINYA